MEHTYAYFDQDYAIMNEVGLIMGESTCAAKTVGWSTKEYSYGYNLFSIHELSKVAMERCATARCAIQLMGDLAVEHGFYANAGTSTAPGVCACARCDVLRIQKSCFHMWHKVLPPLPASWSQGGGYLRPVNRQEGGMSQMIVCMTLMSRRFLRYPPVPCQ